MTEQQVKQLLSRYSRGEATAEEVKLLENWYLAVSRAQKLDAKEADFGGLKKEIWERTLKMAGLEDEIEVDRIPKRQLLARIGIASRQSVRHLLSDKAGTRRLWLASAAAVAAITLGVWLYRPLVILNLFQDPNAIAMKNDIAPGKNTAILTLANGEVINLSDAKTGVVIGDGKIAYSSLRAGEAARQPSISRALEDKTSIYSSEKSPLHDEIASIPRNDGRDAKAMSVSTPRGGQYQVVLPDGTRVWLNADSKLTFPSNFENKKQRIVELEGEAYFAVVHDAKHPFMVKSKGQVVEDIGTEFNIEAYPGESQIRTTLIEGSASVSSLRGRTEAEGSPSLRGGTTKQSHHTVVLNPNQQAIVSNSKINVISIDAAEATAWKRGEFLFNKQPLGSIMKQIARWYDVEIRYEDDKIEGKPFWGSITRFTNVSDVLRMLELTGDVHFKIDGRTIIVKP